MQRIKRWIIPGIAFSILTILGLIIFNIIKSDATLQPASENNLANESLLVKNVVERPKTFADLSAKERLAILEEDAMAAFVENRYLIPKDSSAVHYISQIQMLNPTNSIALKLKEKIIINYKTRAEEAMKQQRFDAAISCYTNLLKLTPDNSQNRKNLVSAITLKVEQEQFAPAILTGFLPPRTKETGIGQPDSIFANGQKNLYSQTQQTDSDTSIPLNDFLNPFATPQLLLNSSISIDTGSAFPGNLPIRDQKSDLSGQLNQLLPIPTSPNEYAVGGKLLESPIIEGLLDSRRRKYRHRTAPQYPGIYEKMNYEGKVYIEVIVDYGGNIESFQVLKSDGKYFTDSAIAALKEFKYKPGTFQGNPVKFKLVETFIFELQKTYWSFP